MNRAASAVKRGAGRVVSHRRDKIDTAKDKPYRKPRTLSAQVKQLINRPVATITRRFPSGPALPLPDLTKPARSIFNEVEIPLIKTQSSDPEAWLFPKTKKREKPVLWRNKTSVEDLSQKSSQQLEPGLFVTKTLGASPSPSTTASLPAVAANVISVLKEKAKLFAATGVDPDIYETVKNALDTGVPSEERRARFRQLLDCDWTVNQLISEGRASVENFNLLIRALGYQAKVTKDRTKVAEALQVAEKMHALGFEPETETFVSLIVAADDDAELARGVYLKMREQPLTPTVKVYGALIKAHIRAGDITSAFALRRKMEDELIVPSCEVYTMLIDSLVTAGKSELAWEEFWHARSWKAIKPDEVMFTVMIKACAMKREPEKALNMLDDMRACGLYPTDVTYSWLIDCLSLDSHFAPKAIEYWRQMQAEEMAMNKQVAKGLLQACASLGDLRLLHKMVSEITSAEIPFSTLYYSLCIQTTATAMRLPKVSDFERVTNLRLAWSIIAAAKGKGFKVTTKLLNSVMEVYKSAGFAQYTTDMLVQFPAFDCAPNKRTYELMFELLGKDLKDAGRFFALWDSNSLRTRDILHTALDLAISSRSANRTVQVLDTMATAKVFPTPSQTENLAQAGKKIPQVHAAVARLVVAQRTETERVVLRRSALQELDVKEHEARLALEGKTPRTPTPEQEVRRKYFDNLKKQDGHSRPWLPLGQYHQLTKRGGELYAKRHDRRQPNLLAE